MSLQVYQPLPISRDYVMSLPDSALAFHQPLMPSQIADLRLAASKMTGAKRRAFEAEMTLKYCAGNPLQAEITFGWSRRTVALGLAERRTGLMCLGAQSAFSGRKRWEDTHPQVAEALCQLAEAHAQQDPTFRTSLAYTRLTVQAARNRSAYENRGHAAACAFWSPSGSRDGASAPHSAASCAAVR